MLFYDGPCIRSDRKEVFNTSEIEVLAEMIQTLRSLVKEAPDYFHQELDDKKTEWVKRAWFVL
jgi:hypothetical protein